MEITIEQFAQIKPYLPRQRGNVSHQNLTIINAILYLAEHDCKWWALPKRFGTWHTIYTRVNRWAKAGVLDELFEQMQRLQLIRIKLEVVVSLDGPGLNDPSAAVGAARKAKRKSSTDLTAVPPKFIWVPRVRVCHRAHALVQAGRRLQTGRRRANSTAVVTLGSLLSDRLLLNYGSDARRR